jgi:hypothetical protein
MLWGDQPADLVSDMLWKVKAVFLKDLERLPTKGEVIAGLKFSTAVLDLPDTVEQANEQARTISPKAMSRLDANYYLATNDMGGTLPQTKAILEVNKVLEPLLKVWADANDEVAAHRAEAEADVQMAVSDPEWNGTALAFTPVGLRVLADSLNPDATGTQIIAHLRQMAKDSASA